MPVRRSGSKWATGAGGVGGGPSIESRRAPLYSLYATLFTHTYKNILLREGHKFLLSDQKKILGNKEQSRLTFWCRNYFFKF